MADKYMTLNGGKRQLTEAADSSAGVANAGDIVALDSSGLIDPSMLPTTGTKSIEVGEAVSAGDFVEIYDDGGTTKIRPADNSNGREANGYVKTSALVAANVNVFFDGANSSLSGLSAGSRYYLSTAGDVTATPLDPATESGIHQFLGVASSATELCVQIEDCITI